MVIIYHIADLHLLEKNYHNIINSFDILIKNILEDENDKILVICGDIFENKNIVTTKIILLFKSMMKLLEDKYITTVIIPGNHDCQVQLDNNEDLITSNLKDCNYKYIHNLNKTGIYKIKGLNFHIYSVLDKKEPNIKSIIDSGSETINNGDNIALIHEIVGGTNLLKFNPGIEYRYEATNLSKIYDLVLLGDVHSTQFIEYNVAYPGSFVQKHIGENLKHGYIRWEKTNETGKYIGQFHNIKQLDYYLKLKAKNNQMTNLPNVNAKSLVFEYKDCSQEYIDKQKLKIEEFYKKKISKIIDITLYTNDVDIDFNIKNGINLITEYLDKHKFNNKVKNKILNFHNKFEEDRKIKNNWKLKWLSWSDIYCYGPNNYIDFTKLGDLSMILGNNKIGKSAIIDILILTLFGKQIRGLGKHIVNKKKNTGRSKCCFTINNDTYIIDKKYSIEHNSVSKQYFYKNGECITKNNQTETYKFIKELIGSYENFIDIIVSLQNRNYFVNMTAKNRLTIMNRCFEISEFLNYGKETKDKLKNLKNKKQNLKEPKIPLIELKNKLNKMISIKDKINNAENNILLIENDIKSLYFNYKNMSNINKKNILNEYKILKQKNKNYVPNNLTEINIDILNNNKTNISNKILKLNVELNHLNKNISKYNNIKDFNKIKDKYNNNIEEHIALLNEKIDNYNYNEINNKYNILFNKKNAINNKITDIKIEIKGRQYSEKKIKESNDNPIRSKTKSDFKSIINKFKLNKFNIKDKIIEITNNIDILKKDFIKYEKKYINNINSIKNNILIEKNKWNTLKDISILDNIDNIDTNLLLTNLINNIKIIKSGEENFLLNLRDNKSDINYKELITIIQNKINKITLLINKCNKNDITPQIKSKDIQSTSPIIKSYLNKDKLYKNIIDTIINKLNNKKLNINNNYKLLKFNEDTCICCKNNIKIVKELTKLNSNLDNPTEFLEFSNKLQNLLKEYIDYENNKKILDLLIYYINNFKILDNINNFNQKLNKFENEYNIYLNKYNNNINNNNKIFINFKDLEIYFNNIINEELLTSIKELDEELNDINIKLDNINNIKKKYDNNKNDLLLLLQYKKYNDYILKNNKIKEYTKTINSLNKKINIIDKDIQYITNENRIQEISNIIIELNKNDEIKKQIDNKENILIKLKNKLKDMNFKENQMFINKNNLLNDIKNTENILHKINKIKEDINIYDIYHNMMDIKKGIPFQILSHMTKKLEYECNLLLKEITDFNILFQFDDNKFEIYTKNLYNNYIIPAEMASGAQKFIMELVIRISILKICNISNPNFLILDEGFSCLDDNHKEDVKKILKQISSKFDFILMISHLNDFKNISNYNILVKTDGEFSNVKYGLDNIEYFKDDTLENAKISRSLTRKNNKILKDKKKKIILEQKLKLYTRDKILNIDHNSNTYTCLVCNKKMKFKNDNVIDKHLLTKTHKNNLLKYDK